MPEDLFADVKQEGETPFETEETETPSESQPGTKPEEEEPSSEGEKTEETEEKSEEPKENTQTEDNIPFHKHPRFKELIEERNEMKERLDELSKFYEEAAPKLSQLTEQDQPIPSWFANAYGEDDKAWKEYQAQDAQRKEQIKQEVFQEIQQQYQQQEQEAKKWDLWVEDNLQSLADKGLKFDRNELVQTMIKYRPTDEQGNLDFKAGYELYSERKALEEVQKAKKTAEKKRVASQTMEGQSEASPRKYKTSAELRNKDWSDL